MDLTSVGTWVAKGDNVSQLFAGNDALIAHYNFLIPKLPSNWTAIATSTESYVFTSGAFDGVTGETYSVVFSTDPNATAALVPVPAALPAFLLALGGLWRLGTARARKT